MIAAAAPVTAEVPTVEDTIPESPLWLLGWKVVVDVPVESVVPDEGEKLDDAVGGVYATDQTTGSPASTPEGQCEDTVHVTLADSEYGAEPAA
jgi:hypothetical protein